MRRITSKNVVMFFIGLFTMTLLLSFVTIVLASDGNEELVKKTQNPVAN
jgi:hypothetical protein